jgi:diguanylate cyclase (GGDEF)-like protein
MQSHNNLNVKNIVPAFKLSVDEQNAILQIQQSVLEMVVNNTKSESVLDELCLLAENLLPNSASSIMLQQPDGHLDVLCAPSVAEEAKAKLNGLIPGPKGGSCGNAVYTNHPVFAVDVARDPRCDNVKILMDELGLCACWSHPIQSTHSTPVGSFALSSFDIREPTDFHKYLLAICAHLAGIVLQRSEQDRQLQNLAYNDPLTGLLNRNSLFEKIELMINKPEKTNALFNVLFLDLDRFKNINDTFGHLVGDKILIMIGQRLKEDFLKPNEILARVGGDEFVFLLPGDQPDDVINQRASALLDIIKMPLLYKNNRFLIDGSIGISKYPDHGNSAQELIKHADTAMYSAKKSSSNHISFYEKSLSQKAELAFNIESQLHDALKNNEFSLYFQPQIDTKSKTLTSVEALIRWIPANKKMISPADFIPIAEETGLIIPIGEWVVRESLALLEPIIASATQAFQLSINLSGIQLICGELDNLISIIDASSIPNELVELEITESVMVQEAESTQTQLNVLKDSGIKLAIDDFGTGYSSLAYLKRFNVNTLKIDRMLIQDIATDNDQRSIVKAAIAMGKGLGLKVVAEGVETKEQLEILEKLDCDSIQGFYFSRPEKLEDLKKNGFLG